MLNIPDEVTWTEGGQSYIVCGFYTKEYEPHIRKLKESVEKLGINHFFKRYEARESWMKNVFIKPEFIKLCLEKFEGHDICYVDADAVVRKPLTLFDDFEADVGVFLKPIKFGWNMWALRAFAGTVFLKNNPKSMNFIDSWIALLEKAGQLSDDQDIFAQAVGESTGIRMMPLPRQYAKIFDKDDAAGEPYIEHFQASRGQFKWRKAAKRSFRAGIAASIVFVLALLVINFR